MTRSLDDLFGIVERMNIPAGFRAEIINGAIVINPHGQVHWTIIRRMTRTIEDARGMDAIILSDVRLDLPGVDNGFAPDVYLVSAGAVADEKGRFSYRDVELVAEVVSESSRRDDYGAKLKTYALAGIPEYLIIDPKTGLVWVRSKPKDGEYSDEATYPFGVRFTLPVSGIDVDSSSWPRV